MGESACIFGGISCDGQQHRLAPGPVDQCHVKKCLWNINISFHCKLATSRRPPPSRARDCANKKALPNINILGFSRLHRKKQPLPVVFVLTDLMAPWFEYNAMGVLSCQGQYVWLEVNQSTHFYVIIGKRMLGGWRVHAALMNTKIIPLQMLFFFFGGAVAPPKKKNGRRKKKVFGYLAVYAA